MRRWSEGSGELAQEEEVVDRKSGDSAIMEVTLCKSWAAKGVK